MKEADAVAALAALSQPVRLRAFRLMVAAGPDGMPAGAIAETLALAPSALSFHLRGLERGGLIRAERRGRHIHYRVAVDRMRDLMAFLSEDCCDGRPELCGDLARFAARSGV